MTLPGLHRASAQRYLERRPGGGTLAAAPWLFLLGLMLLTVLLGAR